MSGVDYRLTERGNKTAIEGITREQLDLEKTLFCGQAFNWSKFKDGAEGFWQYEGVVGNNIVLLRQEEDCIITNLIDDRAVVELCEYLDIDFDYLDAVQKLDLSFSGKIQQVVKQGLGIHILRQDLMETMFTFLVSQRNSMPNIRRVMNRVRSAYGNEIKIELAQGDKDGMLVDYVFPTLKQLSSVTYDDTQRLKLGYRGDYFIDMVNTLKKYPDVLNLLKKSNYDRAIKILKNFNGVGDKVANCIALFSLHHIDAFPVDVHITNIIERDYGGHLDLSKLHPIAGIIQQFMFFSETRDKLDALK